MVSHNVVRPSDYVVVAGIAMLREQYIENITAETHGARKDKVAQQISPGETIGGQEPRDVAAEAMSFLAVNTVDNTEEMPLGDINIPNQPALSPELENTNPQISLARTVAKTLLDRYELHQPELLRKIEQNITNSLVRLDEIALYPPEREQAQRQYRQMLYFVRATLAKKVRQSNPEYESDDDSPTLF